MNRKQHKYIHNLAEIPDDPSWICEEQAEYDKDWCDEDCFGMPEDECFTRYAERILREEREE